MCETEPVVDQQSSEMAAFELNVRGYSDWVDVFTMDEWVSFGYTQDLQFYYCAG